MPSQIFTELTEPITVQHPAMVRPHMKARFAAALIAAGFLYASASFAATTLDQIDVVTSRYGTELKLHADQPIQHKVIKATDTEMVVRFTGVVPTNTIKTNFAKASDVSHVIFQPDGRESLSMMLRGKALGQPVIQVVYPTVERHISADRFQQPKKSYQTPLSDAPEPLDASGYSEVPEPKSALAEGIHSKPSVEKAIDVTVAAAATPDVALPQVAEELPKPSAQTVTDVPEPSSEQALDSQLFGASSDLSEEAVMQTAVASPSTVELLFEQLSRALGGIDIGQTVMTSSALLILLAGLGFFIKHKWQTIQALASSNGGNSSRRQTPRGRGRSSSIRELMREQRESEREVYDYEEENFSPRRHPKKANPWASRPNTRVNQPTSSTIARVQAASRATTASRPATNGGARKPAATGARQVVNSYQQQAANPTLKQNLSAQATTQARSNMRSAGPTGNSNEPLPNNPRITSFLEDVAQYMERDGQTGKAQRIQRNIPRD